MPKPLWPAVVPPKGMMVPGGSVANTFGSRLGRPSASSRHSSGNCSPAFCRRAHMPLVTMDEEMRSEEHTSELQSLMRISYAVFCLKKKKNKKNKMTDSQTTRVEQHK